MSESVTCAMNHQSESLVAVIFSLSLSIVQLLSCACKLAHFMYSRNGPGLACERIEESSGDERQQSSTYSLLFGPTSVQLVL